MTKLTKDPSSHPANGPLTEERLIRVRDELQRKLKYGRDHFFADAVKAIDEVLALRKAEQEQVYQVLNSGGWRDVRGDIFEILKAEGLTTRILYATPQHEVK